MSHPELASEQQYVDAAYARLDDMRDAARRVAEGFAGMGAGGTHQARLERDAAYDVTRRRLAALDIGEAPLCFGRVDLRPDAAKEPRHAGNGANGEAGHAVDATGAPIYYVGRLSVTDDEQVPLVVDWRAPVAEPFYRATAVEPMGVARRRHFLTKASHGRELVGLDDEVFDRDVVEASGMTVIGEGALLVALERSRTGRMHDIVATIQAEQDEAIRAALQGVLVVAGGAGTGKTAVALHRAAYLLYTYRRQLATQGVLLVGPSTIFLRYIDQVLPSLGEDDVQLATPAGLKPTYRVRGTEVPAVAAMKGEARMATVVERALRDREHPLAREMLVTVDGNRLRLRRGASARIVERTRRGRGTHNEKRPRIVRAVIDSLIEQYRRALGVTAPTDDLDWERELYSRLRRLPEVKAALDRMWPVLTGGELIHDLYSFPALIRSAADGVLTRDEQEGLHRPRAENLREVPWTEADLPLIDEADALLGSPESARPRRRGRRRNGDEAGDRVVAELGVGGFLTGAEVARRYAGDAPRESNDDEPRTFGHVLVDEAQDLSPMQWRMLARRCPTGSMTLVGDFGQSSRAGAANSWDEVLALLPRRVQPRVVTLTVNYRTPSEIMDIAHHVLAVGAPDVPPTSAVRSTGEWPSFEHVDAESLVERAAAAAREVVGDGTVAIVAPAHQHGAFVEALADVGAVADSVEALDAAIAVLTPIEAKGLEFDHVVVVEPSALAENDAAGMRLLYVTLTRATRRLVVVHADPLPEPLAAAASTLPDTPVPTT